MRKIFITFLLTLSCLFALAQGLQSYNVQRALEAVRSGDADGALNYLAQEIQQYPNNGYANYFIAAICKQMNEPQAAMRFAKKAITAPSNLSDMDMLTEACGILAKYCLQGGDTTKALAYYQIPVSINKKYVNAYIERADLLTEMRNAEQLIADGKICVKLEPKNPTSYIILAEGLRFDGQHAEAVKMIQTAMTKLEAGDKRASYFHYLTSLNQTELHQYDQAIHHAIEAVRVRNNNMSAMLQLIEIADSADYQQVIDSVSYQAEQDPTNGWWWLIASDTYDHQNLYIDGLRAAMRAVRLNEIPNTYSEIAEHFRHYVGDMEMAERYYRLHLEKDSTSAVAHLNLADYYHDLARYDEAIRFADKAISLDADRAPFYYIRGRIYRDMHNYQKAIDNYYMALVANPEDIDYYFGIAQMYRLMGDTAQAAQIIEQAKRQAEVLGKELAANHCVIMGDYDRAAELAVKMVTKEGNPNQLYNAACIYALIGQTDKAMEHLHKALDSGFRNFHHIAWDEDLDNLRTLPEFEQLINEHKAQALELQSELRESLSLQD